MKATPIPIYYKISKQIIDQIRQKKLKPGDKIPSENEIRQRFEVSNTTARKVLLEIEKGGFAQKIKGKGTFVRENVQVNRAASKVLSFTKNMLQQGIEPQTKLLDCEIVTGGISKEIRGRRYTLNDEVCKITRLRFGNDKPILKEIRYISLKYCPEIDKLDLEGSLYDIYEKQFDLHITRIDQSLSSVIIDQSQNQIFGNEGMIPGFQVDGVTFCGTELILEIEESIYNGEFYKFNVEARP